MKKRKDECQFCSSRSCYTRIVRFEDPIYDEVFCHKHMDEAHQKCNEVLGIGKNMRHHISSTGKMSRGEKVNFN